MDEYNWTPLGVARFSDVQLNASSASDHMALHGASPWLARATGARAVDLRARQFGHDQWARPANPGRE
jgi:hypothetical protein